MSLSRKSAAKMNNCTKYLLLQINKNVNTGFRIAIFVLKFEPNGRADNILFIKTEGP
ncbi:hypothetical protein Leryth_007143 [Lithospermum erythrorhizon]|nr:hypothetical protein Leryth_007143 [Lithospermum erythrorhizon]